MQSTLDRYRLFEGGNYINLMPKLVDSGFSPMSVADIMRVRLEAVKTGAEKDLWLNHYFDSCDGIAYMGGSIKIVCGVPQLKDISPDAELSSGALVLTLEQYSAMEGPEFSQEGLAGIGKLLKKSEVKSHPIWRALARDNRLLSEYADLIFSEAKEQHGYEKAMGVYLSSQPTRPTLRAWFVGSLSGRSDADDGCSLYNLARLVGVGAEGAAKNLEARILEELNAGRAFEFNGQLYVPVSSNAGIKLK